MDVLTNYLLPFVGMLVFLVVVHELGHYFTAKLFGIKVLEAGIGYPPRAWGFEWKGTIYSINWLPLGGFVRLLGEEDPEDPQSLAAQKAWKRIIVLGAGSFMNIVLPVVLFTIFFLFPQDIARGPAVVALVEENSPAEAAGVEVGDQIISINGQEIRNLADASREIRLNMGETMTWRVKHQEFGGSDTQIEDVKVRARWAPPEGQGPTGIQIRNQVAGSQVCLGERPPGQCFERESHSFLGAIREGYDATWDSLILARNQIIMIFKGGGGPDVAGPVGLGQATGDIVKESGWLPLLEFAALLSINLAIINILPLPMLDGGRIAFVLLEVVRRGRRIAPEKEAIVHLIGLALILTLAAVVTYVDIARLIGGRSLFE